MKLELKHIACYLPFDLQYKGEYGGVSTMRKLEYCRPYNKETDSFTDEIGVDGYFIQYIKPLLLPISCLTEDQELLQEFTEIVGDIWFNDDYTPNQFVYQFVNGIIKFGIGKAQEVLDFMHANHIDIFYLIPAGLAVDKREVGK